MIESGVSEDKLKMIEDTLLSQRKEAESKKLGSELMDYLGFDDIDDWDHILDGAFTEISFDV